jgi:hypothetical protein
MRRRGINPASIQIQSPGVKIRQDTSGLAAAIEETFAGDAAWLRDA